MLEATRRLLSLVAIWCYIIPFTSGRVTLSSLRVEHNIMPFRSPIEPLFSWTIDSAGSGNGVAQVSYQILVSGPYPDNETVWDSGIVISNRTQFIRYTGLQLLSNARYTWSVNVSTSAGSEVASSEFVTDLSTVKDLNHESWIEGRDLIQASELMNYFQLSSWIWTADGDLETAPPGDRGFRYRLDIPPGEAALSALIFVCVDNQFILYVNGNQVKMNGDGAVWWEIRWSTVLFVPSTTEVLFAILGTNDANGFPPAGMGPAGVLVAFQITLTNGSLISGYSDKTWLSNHDSPNGFQSLSFDDSSWPFAKELVKFGGGPWKTNINFPSNLIALPPTLSPTTLSTTTSSITTSLTPPAAHKSTIPPPNPDINKSRNDQNLGGIVGGVLGSAVFLFLILAIYLWHRRNMRKRINVVRLHPFNLIHQDNRSIHNVSSQDRLPPRYSL